jgi:predicted PurR-regulated permease PerM
MANVATHFLKTQRQTIFRVFFFGVFLFLIYQLLRLLSPFFTPIMVAGTLALIFYPLHTTIHRRLPREGMAAALSTGFLMALVILPTLFFVWILAQEARNLYPWAYGQFQNGDPASSTSLPPALDALWMKTRQLLISWGLDPRDVLLKNLDQSGEIISTHGARLLKNILFLFFDLAIVGFTLFFLFRDGAKMVRWVMDLIPMEKPHKEHILQRLDQTLSAVVRGLFITAAMQGLLAGIGFALVGLPFAVALGFGTAFTALIPFVGATAVWLPVSIYLWIQGAIVKSIFLFLWGFFLVSLIDNFLRPILIGDKAKLPIFLLFFGMMGGLQVYGVIGILVGPLLIASVLAFTKIYRDQMQKAPEPNAPAPQPPS